MTPKLRGSTTGVEGESTTGFEGDGESGSRPIDERDGDGIGEVKIAARNE